ncbi:hypothetical protein ACFTXM_04885 [Streptomyces sp. NPDC056930]|uniref:hypothetical protein n=1 Tax=Streptomyces sp. NPDC056930 TaxID=3345967 RepID=UPI0036267F41
MDDDLWAIDRAVVTGLAGQGSGARPAPGRLRIQGILHVPHNGMARQLLPPEPGFGSGQTCRRRVDVRGRVSRPREGGVPSPVARRKTGSKHHLICDGRGKLLKVMTTAVNVNDVSPTLVLVDNIPPIPGRRGRPPRHPARRQGLRVPPARRCADDARSAPTPAVAASTIAGPMPARQGERQPTSGRQTDQLL